MRVVAAAHLSARSGRRIGVDPVARREVRSHR
jgi:hypothetical protein